MKKMLLLILTLYFSQTIYSQKRADTWYFGDNAGIDFSSGTATLLTDSAMIGSESNTAISDCNGQLIFYTDGINVWDATHTITPNGSGLLGHVSTSQIIIIPQTETNYFIIYGDNEGGTLRYSEFDTDLNNGLGDIKFSSKNTILHDNASERKAATYTADKTGIWLLTMNVATNSFYLYLITNTGISPPIITPVNHDVLAICCEIMKFSPDGNWLAYSNRQTNGTGGDPRLYTFDNVTGQLTFHSSLTRNASTNESRYGISFSPNSSKLYIGTIYNIQPGGAFNRLYQYDMTSPDILQSELIIYTQIFSGSGAVTSPFGGLQIGPDNKIYIARWNMPFLAVINNPDQLGQNCNFVLDGFDLNGRDCSLALPNFVENYFDTSETADFCQPLLSIDDLNYNNDIFKIYPNPTVDYITINFNNPTQKLSIEISNPLGKKVLESTYSNAIDIELNISNLTSGIYFLKLKINDRLVVKRIMKQ